MRNRVAVGVALCLSCSWSILAAYELHAAAPAQGTSKHEAAAQDPMQVPAPLDPATFQDWSSGRYRITPSDVIELKFPYVPEFDQVVTVQPDGYVALRGVGDVRAQSRSVPELRQLIEEAYAPILRDPVVTVVLKEFEKPYFIASGEVKTPGRVELRGAVTLTQGLALAGGTTEAAKHSQVLLLRRYSQDMVEVKQIDVKKMYASKNLSEDYILRPGDTVFVPRNVISKISPYLPIAGMFVYLTPLFHLP